MGLNTQHHWLALAGTVLIVLVVWLCDAAPAAAQTCPDVNARGAGLVLTPPDAELPQSTEATFEATAFAPFPMSKAGAQVSFTVISGPDVGQSRTAWTAAHDPGTPRLYWANLTVHNTGGVGCDVISATTGTGAHASTATASVQWVRPVQTCDASIGFFAALKCARVFAHKILEIGQCIKGIGTFFVPEAKFAEIFKAATSLARAEKRAKSLGKDSTVGKLIFDLRGLKGSVTFAKLAKAVKDAKDAKDLLSQLWSLIKDLRSPQVAQIARDLLNLAGLGPCVDLLAAATTDTSGNLGGTVVENIAAGNEHVCALLGSRGITCWGDDEYGELGDGMFTGASTPTPTTGIGSAVAVAAGNYFSCALLSAGGVDCWGYDAFGPGFNQAETGSRPTPTGIQSISDAKRLAANFDHACVVVGSGAVRCWGQNDIGDLGNGSTSTPDTFPNPWLPVSVQGINNAIDVSAGAYHSCALLATGSVMCWGDNSRGQLGNGGAGMSPSPRPVAKMPSARSISAGIYQSCAVLTTGGIDCWGANDAGQLGDGTKTDRTTPTPVAGISSATFVSTGSDHSCAVLSGGGVDCWGDNTFGQLGNGKTSGSTTPVQVVDIRNATAVTSAGDYSCAALTTGRVSCWGFLGPYLGQGDRTVGPSQCPSEAVSYSCSTTPLTVSGLSGVTTGSPSRLPSIRTRSPAITRGPSG